MILTCPDCATSYFVDDKRIPEHGRAVKCSSCGARWSATKEPAAPPQPAPKVIADPPPPPEPALAVEVPVDDLEVVAIEPAPAPEPELEQPAARARRAPPPRRAEPVRRDSKVGAVAASISLAATLVALVAGAVLFRSEVMRLWPQSSAAYARLGLPMPGAGLVIEGVHLKPTFVSGRPALAVAGVVRNMRNETVTAPALRINLLNRAGEPIAARIARPLNPQVPAGSLRHFSVAIADPPANMQDVEVVFETAAERTAASRTGPAAAHPSPAPATVPLSDHG